MQFKTGSVYGRLTVIGVGEQYVSWSDRCSKWVARIHENSEEFILGYFDSFDEAVRVREVAELNIYEELKPEAREYE